MPMQPSPIAETSKLLFPSLRFCIFGIPVLSCDLLIVFFEAERLDARSLLISYKLTPLFRASCGHFDFPYEPSVARGQRSRTAMFPSSWRSPAAAVRLFSR